MNKCVSLETHFFYKYNHHQSKQFDYYSVLFRIELARTVVLVSALATLGSLLRKASPKSLQATFVITYIVRYAS